MKILIDFMSILIYNIKYEYPHNNIGGKSTMCICEDCLNSAICDLAFSGDFPCENVEHDPVDEDYD